jgi:hypothetical protein
MDFSQFIWIGEVVEYNGQRATVMDIDIPYLYLLTGKEEPEKVHFSTVRKIKYDAPIWVLSN